MTENLSTLSLPDGRTLGYAEWGDPAGSPIFVLHGTPGCRLNRHPDNAKIAATGARVITYDRPGYGESSRHRGRVVNDCVADITALADSLDIGKFAVTGGSGGGPHCLAVAAGLPDRVSRAACIVGVAPYDLMGPKWYDGMDAENVKEFGWALEGEQKAHDELAREAANMLERMSDDPANILGDFEIPDADREILSRPDIAALMVAAVTECVRNGVWGWVDDDLAFTRAWGFDLSTIEVPTTLWWGSKDVLVPPQHGEWLAARVPNATTRIDDSGGHQADPDTHIQALYPWLIDGTPWQD